LIFSGAGFILESMKTLIQTLFNWVASRLRERWHLPLEYLALRHQLKVLKRSVKRPSFDLLIAGCGYSCQLGDQSGRRALKLCKPTPFDAGGDRGFGII